ncbi:protein terminal ear1 homolog [Lactuca sativa]|uniref:protein terminal ear1 homolog n=1 Tax=Lactuca sativa TaxID=4236 RepID=UPI000CB190BD|nr:protein terminal ear1 homolog [Lactuca sativa]
MAIEIVSSRPLDPRASPYNTIYHRDFYVYHIPRPLPYYLILPPVPPRPPYFWSYNAHQQPLPAKSLPLPLPPPSSPGKKSNFSLASVPSGPRIPKSRLPGRHRRVNKVVRFGSHGCGGTETKTQLKPVEKKTTLEKVGRGGKRRWKNRSGEYQEILPLDTETSSVMIKNIPNKYTRKLLIQTLDDHCKLVNQKINKDSIDEKNSISAYDFLYLPIDFNNRVNAGFAFVNFTTPEAASRFRDTFHGKHWDFFDSPKIAEITRARIQGKRRLVNNCKTMDFSYGSEEDMPVSFEPARDGSDGVHSKMTVLGKFLR